AQVAYIDAVDRDASGVDVVEPCEQRSDRALPGSSAADERERRAGLEVERQSVQHRPPGLIAEADVLEADVAAQGCGPRARALDDGGAGAEHLDDAPCGGGGLLQRSDALPDHPHRPD